MDRKLQAFFRTAELGSVSRSAAALGMTQSALSKALQRLEEEFGATLLERQPRGVRLTEAGKVLYRRGGRAALELEHAREEITALRSRNLQHLKIGVGPIYMLEWVRKPITNIASHYPGVSFEILTSSSRIALPKLLKGEIDAFLGYIDPDQITENVENTVIKRVKNFPFGVSKTCIPGGISIENSDLVARQPWVNYTEAVTTNERLRDYWRINFGVDPNVRFVTNSMRTALSLAADNKCWICLPSPLAEIAGDHGLQRVEVARPFWEFDTGCAVRRSSLGYLIIREFVELIRASTELHKASAG
jgi:DNA-binding transcriptional LysR family regulator